MKTAALIFVIASLIAGGGSVYDFGVDGAANLCVSKQDLDQSLIPYTTISIHLRTENGNTPGFAVLFNAPYMQKIMNAYQVNAGFPASNLSNQLWGEIDFVAESDRRRYGPGMRAGHAAEIWYRRPPCEAAIIQPITNPEYYRAQCDSGDENALLVNRLPNPATFMPDLNSVVVALCRENLIKYGPYKGAVDRTCERSVIIDGLFVTYHFQELNARLVPQLDAFFRNKIREWKHNCE